MIPLIREIEALVSDLPEVLQWSLALHGLALVLLLSLAGFVWLAMNTD